jgi:NAD(P)-dependent dehydrogenase (short-subunit alcohol dehydrogenase family)
MKELSGKKVLVTGGTRGIGAAIASLFAENGAEVTVTGTMEPEKNNFRFLGADFSNPEKLESFISTLKSERFNILINNAGINIINPLEKLDFLDWQKVQMVNVQAAVEITQALVPHMREHKFGRIVNISSVFGVVSKAQRMAYTASKAALIGLTKTMAIELGPSGILVNSISPGFIDTEMTQRILGPHGIAEMTAKVPLKKLGKPLDIAELALYLCSNRNQFLTGQNLIIDGGFTCE